MIPDENFRKYFEDAEIPELKGDFLRSSCLRIGAFWSYERFSKNTIFRRCSPNSLGFVIAGYS